MVKTHQTRLRCALPGIIERYLGGASDLLVAGLAVGVLPAQINERLNPWLVARTST